MLAQKNLAISTAAEDFADDVLIDSLMELALVARFVVV